MQGLRGPTVLREFSHRGSLQKLDCLVSLSYLGQVSCNVDGSGFSIEGSERDHQTLNPQTLNPETLNTEP